MGIDFLPIIGDAKGFAECGVELSLGSCLGAVAGLIPLLGDGAKILLKRGDDVIEVVADGGGGLRVLDDIKAPRTDAEAGDPAGFVNSSPTSNGSFADGGHLIDRHVGKSEQDLLDRANGMNAPRGGASSFSNLEAAENYTNQVIDARRADIDAYINSGTTRPMEFDFDAGQSTGRWVPNGGSHSQPVTGVRVVIKPNPNVPRGYDVITGYPVDPINFTNP